MNPLSGALASYFAERFIRLFVVVCIGIGLMAGAQALYYRHRLQELEDQLVTMGSRVAELRFHADRSAALMLQYRQRCDIGGG